MVKTKPETDLPKGILVSDLKYPSFKSKDKLDYEAGSSGQLTFHKTDKFGWCLATLHISNSRRANQTDRTYAIRVSDGEGVRIGSGPHVTKTITVYVRTSRTEKLKNYIDLYKTGMVKANTVRDRISSRRAQGVEMRAEGKRHWFWNV